MESIAIYLEFVPNRSFASALDWPGWARSGRDEAGALQALLDYAPRYARILTAAKIDFAPPADLAGFSIVERVVGAEGGYLSSLAWKWDKPKSDNPYDLLIPTRQAVREGLAAAAHGETPRQGPRGGRVWSPRYFVRRLGWHLLDHLWEIEDRLQTIS